MADAGGRSAEPLVSLDRVTIRIRDRKLLADTSWIIRPGEQWAILGPNGSGKSSLVRTIAGELPSASGHVRIGNGNRISLVSFELQQQILSAELEQDVARHFSGKLNNLLTPRQLIASSREAKTQVQDAKRSQRGEAAARLLGFGHLLDRPFRTLSSGEMRKALIVRALASDPTLLILDEPFDGLDTGTSAALAGHLRELMESGAHLLLVTHRAEEVIDGITHVLLLGENRITAAGKRQEVLTRELPPAFRHSTYGSATSPAQRNLMYGRELSPSREGLQEDRQSGNSLVEFHDVTVRYNENALFSGLDWTLKEGERWGVIGPNGSGKTTMINLIVGDNLQGYSNDVRVFGVKRGSGDSSIWDIRKRIGLVTPRLQLTYLRPDSALEVVLSGFYDSVGLYKKPTEKQLDGAREWLTRFGALPLADRPFLQLSYGQRRIVLMARAMVKDPELLILDEPCLGLDPENRRRVLETVEIACRSSTTSLIYVTHHGDEQPRCLTHLLFLPAAGGRPVVHLCNPVVTE